MYPFIEIYMSIK